MIELGTCHTQPAHLIQLFAPLRLCVLALKVDDLAVVNGPRYNPARMNIRTATDSDAPDIARIHVETWRAAYRGQIPDSILDALDVERRTNFWRERLEQSKGVVFVAEKDGGIIGFCDLIPSRDKDADPETVAEIAAFYVSPDCWRMGTGSALCNWTITTARTNGYKSITLWVLASNAPARCFYERMGFCPDGMTKTETHSKGAELHEVRYRWEIPY